MKNSKRNMPISRRSLKVLPLLLWLSLSNTAPIGGQAVIEGVMMRSRDRWAVAVRDRSGFIHTMTDAVRRRHPLLRLPLLRGVILLIDSVIIGVRALNFSATMAYPEDESPNGTAMALSFLVAFVLGIALFVFVPLYLTKLLSHLWPVLRDSRIAFNLVDGIFRLGMFLLYLFVVGLWSEMGRIFQYHGAEHKVINAYESGASLEAENTMRFSQLHPRCGTSFLLIVMCISILVFSFIPSGWPFWQKFLGRLLLIPVVAGVSYEVLKFGAKRRGTPLFSPLIIPGLMLQRLTTREPEVDQLEVAIVALKEVL